MARSTGSGGVGGAEWRPWPTLASLFALSAGFIAYAIAPASILPLIMEAFALSKATASASISAIFLTWALLQIPAGLVLDRRDNRWLIAIGGVVFVLAGVAGLVANTYVLFLLTQLVAGGSVALFFVGAINVLGHVLPADRRALGMSIFIAGPPVGVALAQVTGPLLAEPYGWRAPLLAYTALGAAGLAGFLALLGPPVRPPGRVTVEEFLTTLGNRSVLLVSLAGLCTYTIWTFLVTWMPAYGTEVLGFGLAAAGAATALVPLAGIVARPSGGWLSDRLGGRLVPVIVTSFFASILMLVLLNQAPSPLGFAVLLALAGAAVNLAVGLYLVYVNALAASATQASSLSVLLTFSQVGNLIAPVAGGWAIERFSWSGGFGFAIGLAVLGLAATVLVARLADVEPRRG